MQVDEVALGAEHGLDHQVLDLLPDDRMIDTVCVKMSP